jgi:hypothetical protein
MGKDAALQILAKRLTNIGLGAVVVPLPVELACAGKFMPGLEVLGYLSRFPINTLKIDQSFISQISANPDDAIIVSAVISMGKSLKRRVVAEGVETSEQYAFLRALNCEEGQGYYFGRPMPAAARHAARNSPACRPNIPGGAVRFFPQLICVLSYRPQRALHLSSVPGLGHPARRSVTD